MAITFVFCIESGPLEGMTVRAVESLRRWGGGLAQSPVIAVKPRFGPALKRNTLQKFDQLGVTYLDTRPTRRYRWYNFLNKPSAVLAADEAATTELIAWMDSDVLFVGEPGEYELHTNEDIAAYAPNGWIATTGPGDPNEPFWVEMCQAVGINIDELPFVETEEDQRRVRLYWNAGIFAYRKSTGYARVYRDYCIRLLDARVAHTKQKLFYHEQIAMALAGAKLRWKKLARSHNFTMEAWSKREFPVEQLQTARVIHYHDFMREENRARFMSTLRAARPDVAEFIGERGPLEMGGSKAQEWLRKSLKFKRGIQQRRHLMRCRML